MLEEAAIEDPILKQEAAAQRHYRAIVDTIINLKCPHCSNMFIDFSDCYSVRCHSDDNAGCKLYFCGWCLEKCYSSDQCKGHARQCSYNPHKGRINGGRGEKLVKNGTSIPLSEFNIVHGRRQKPLILQYLKDEITNEELRKDVKVLLQLELDDKGVDLDN
jgi:hypothetical protein